MAVDITHGSIAFKPWLPVYIHDTCNNVAVPNCISPERELFIIICRENQLNQGLNQDPEKANKVAAKVSFWWAHFLSLTVEFTLQEFCSSLLLSTFFFHSPSLAQIFFVFPQHFCYGPSHILWRDQGKWPTSIFYPAQFSLTITLTLFEEGFIAYMWICAPFTDKKRIFIVSD